MACQSTKPYHTVGTSDSSLYTQRMFDQMANGPAPIVHFSCDDALNELESLYRNKDYKACISKASLIFGNFCGRHSNYRAYEILADSRDHLGYTAKTLRAYAAASRFASNREKKELMGKSLQVAVRLKPEKLIEMSATIAPDAWRKDLLLNVGMSDVENDKADEALLVLKTFYEHYPMDRRIDQVKKAIQRLSARAAFNRQRIGVMLPLSGAYQLIGQRILEAVEIALDNFNRQGDSRNFSIVVKDTCSDPQKAVSAVRLLEKEGVAGIIGPIVTAREAAIEANRLKMPMIVMTQKENVPEVGKYIFRNFITPEMQTKALISYLTEVKGIHRFAVLYPDENYGISFKNAFIHEVSSFGGMVNAIESYNPHQTDFTAQIKKFIKSYQLVEKDGEIKKIAVTVPRKRHANYKAIVDFDALFIPDSPEVAAMIAPQLRFYDIKDVIMVGTNLWSSGKLVQMAGPYVQGAIYPSAFDTKNPSIKIRDFVTAYAGLDSKPPGAIEAIGYDTAYIMLRALYRTEIKSRMDLVKSLMTIQHFRGITGMSSFKPSGEPVMNLRLCKIVLDRAREVGDSAHLN